MALEGWEIDTMHSGIYFSVHHMVLAKVRGRFDRWSASLVAEEGALERTSVDVTVDASSIDTGVAGRDAHLRSSEFLDVAKHPAITFRGARVEKLDANHLRLTGDLTLRGVTRGVVFEVEDAGRTRGPTGDQRAIFTAKTSLDRRDFGIRWNQKLEAGGVLVGDRIEIEVAVQAIKPRRPRRPDQPKQPTLIRASAGHGRDAP